MRGCFILFVVTSLAASKAHCGPLGNVLREFKEHVDHALHKVRETTDDHPSPPRSRQGHRVKEHDDMDQRQFPITDQPTRIAPTQPKSAPEPSDDSGRTAHTPERHSSPKSPANVSADHGKGDERQPGDSVNKTAPADGGTQSATKHEVIPPLPSPPSQTSFAKPVPGKPGFVYPPGVEEESQNMLDVRGFPSGQKMRDPRTGKTFLVP